MTSPTITIYVGADLKFRWARYCKARGVKTSNALRDMMVFLLSKESNAAVPSAGVSQDIDEGKSQRIVIRLKPSTLKELQNQARLQGFSTNRFISALADVHVAKDTTPVFGQYELDVVTASTAQLARIGNNLNQVSRAINRNSQETDLLRVELLEELTKLINNHIQEVATLIESNLQRWQGGKHG